MSDLLQTQPYLTCVPAGQTSKIVYAIDELQPVEPDVTPPEGAAFAVVGLDRSVVWHRDSRALEALQRAASAPAPRRSLTDTYGDRLIADLVGRGWLQPPDELCREYFLTTAQIEVTAHCNWGCHFCPVSVDRKPAATMSMPLFEEIIDKLSPYPTIRYVTFHFYNEPTLDRFFEERLAVLANYGRKLRLFTNGSQLTQEKIDALVRTGVADLVTVNLPALDEEEFRALTHSRTHHRSVTNLDAAVDAGLPVTIAVNAANEQRLEALRRRYESRGVSVNPTVVSDRAGTLTNQFNQEVRIDGPLRGCGWPVNHAHFSVAGDMFICCNDYYQREKFGNIRSGTVHDVMTSPEAVLTRRRVFGVLDAPCDYLCRECHDQLDDFPTRQFRPLATFPVLASSPGEESPS